MNETFTSRSAILTRQSCGRKWWWEYGHPTGAGVPGIVSSKLNMDLLTGSGYHVGIENLLRGSSLDEALGRSLEGDGIGWPGLWPLMKSKGLILSDKEDAYYVAQEQAAIVEALIRGYYFSQLPVLKARFDIIEVERDGEEIISIPEVPDFQVRFGYRADALLLEKETLDLYILSLKTAKHFYKKREEVAHRDMQGLSEVAVVDQRLGRWDSLLKSGPSDITGFDPRTLIPEWFYSRWREGASALVTGVKMEFALKGDRREWPKGSGKYYYSNHLIRPWKKLSLAEQTVPKRRRAPTASSCLELPYAVNWEFKDDLGANHTLGAGWRPVNIWEDMGVKNWIEFLMENQIQDLQPGEAVESMFVTPFEFYRSDEDIDAWKQKTVYSERRTYEGRKKVLESTTPKTYLSALNEHFDTHSDRCDYPVTCPYQPICFGGSRALLFDPLISGMYEPRVPNHANELIQIKES